jgi:hypothetical protein
VLVREFRPFDFLLIFSSAVAIDHVLHAPPPRDAPFILMVQRWRHQLCTCFSPLCFKVLLALENLSVHA